VSAAFLAVVSVVDANRFGETLAKKHCRPQAGKWQWRLGTVVERVWGALVVSAKEY